MKFELSIWDGYSNNKRIVEEDNYVAAVTRYASHLPPAYIWSIVPIRRMKMSDNRVTFRRNDPEGMKDLAVYLAQLTREGVVYTINNGENYVAVTLTGGF